MFNIDLILKGLQNDKSTQRAAMTGAAGLAVGMLMGGGGKKFLKKAATAGAIAAVGGLAYKAWQSSQQGQNPGEQPPSAKPWSTPADREAFIPEAGKDQEELGKSLVRAMIAAAKADGKIDAEEREAIFFKLAQLQLGSEEKAFVFDELAGPLDVDAVVARADTPQHAAEIYAASLVAIDADTEVERAYLADLARRLSIDPRLVAEIHKEAGAQAPLLDPAAALGTSR